MRQFLIYFCIVLLLRRCGSGLFNKSGLFFANQGSFVEFFKWALAISFSPQVKELWLSAVVASMWGLWNQRNACKFEDKNPNVKRLCCASEG